jgi:alpha-tubulin suppressor-like RCC1 family protein
LVIAPDGTVMCQGRKQFHVCGADASVKFVEKFSPVPGVPKGRAVAVGDPWISMVLGENGKVYVWGKNDFGFLGGTDRGPTYVRDQPTVVEGIGRAKGIAAFVHGGAALLEDGTVWMWGEDKDGLLGTGKVTPSWQSGKQQFTPARVNGIDRVVQIAGGYNHMLALKADGTVWAWGANKYAQLGMGLGDSRGVPVQIRSLTGVTRIYAEGSMSAAKMADGSWLAWGGAPSLKPPTDDGPPVLEPSPLPGLLRDCTDLASGVAAFRDGTVRTWGGNSFGSLGTGGSVDATSLRGVLVKSLSGIVRVWSGVNRVLALKSDGTLYMWGPSGSEDAAVYRVPKAMATFPLAQPGK